MTAHISVKKEKIFTYNVEFKSSSGEIVDSIPVMSRKGKK